MKLSELGEFGLIDVIQHIAEKSQNPQYRSWRQLLVGIGDDAAAWQSSGYVELATTDTLVQDVHFDLNIISWTELGWKAMAVNLSDIAAMGGIPEYALISLAMPSELEVEDVSDFCQGMAELADKFEVAIAGGNLASAPTVVITITIIGYSQNNRLLKRSTARPGEQIAVTGNLGLSAAGLRMLQGKTKFDTETASIFRQAHLRPIPRVKEGHILLQQGVNTAIDISDGLIADLDHLCQASKANARIQIDKVPVHPLVESNFPDYQELALSGGEDYELLFTADKTIVDKVKRVLDCSVSVIGSITKENLPARVTLVDSKGNFVTSRKAGWEHFKDESFKTQVT
jgi:thiamine-monophosphate kinase